MARIPSDPPDDALTPEQLYDCGVTVNAAQGYTRYSISKDEV